jgi:hypothetical protein
MFIERRAEWSATKIEVLETCKPLGSAKDAEVPEPSTTLATPLPARVVTAADAISIARMRAPWESATYRVVPSAEISISSGVTKDAAVPTPSVEPLLPDPAKIDAVPVEDIL